jgi:hemerythrin-like metal-binding protein
MKELIWDDEYTIGVEELDRQHMEFIKLLRRFNIGIQKGIPVPVQLRILQELLKYADYHFTSEENIMLFTRYPDLTTQQSEHSRLLNSLDRRIDSYKRAPDHGEQLSDFLIRVVCESHPGRRSQDSRLPAPSRKNASLANR